MVNRIEVINEIIRVTFLERDDRARARARVRAFHTSCAVLRMHDVPGDKTALANRQATGERCSGNLGACRETKFEFALRSTRKSTD